MFSLGASTYQVPTGNITQQRGNRRLLECGEDNFLTQPVREPAREGAPLELLFVEKDLWAR